MHFQKKLSAIAASTALVFTGFAPAMAAPVNPAAAPADVIDIASLGWNANSDKAEGWRSSRGYRGYRGYGYGRGYRRHRNRVDAGDVLAGILIIGGIAAIASAASKDQRSNDRDYRSDRRNNDRYDDRRSDNRGDRGTGSMDTAINICSNAAERQAGNNARVSEIESVARDGAGWRVEGGLSGSEQRTFLCGTTDGRVDFVQLGSSDLAFAN
tara:strand:+ start:298 stop:933 length:636 start_codon:yes stop_codon:yes gene_type:complete